MNSQVTQELKDLLCNNIKLALVELMPCQDYINVIYESNLDNDEIEITHKFNVDYLGKSFCKFSFVEYSQDLKDEPRLRLFYQLKRFQDNFSYNILDLLQELRLHEIKYKAERIIFNDSKLTKLINSKRHSY